MTDARDATAAPMAGADKPEPERSPQDQAAVNRLQERRKRKRAPRFEVAYEGDTANITAAGADSIYEHAQLADLFDTADSAFSSGMLRQIANIARTGKQLTSRELNFVLATVRALDPRDATEVLLTVQMAAIHNAVIVAARRLTHCENLAQQDSNSNLLNKLARTFAAQIEALKRYRSNGEQNVRVTYQHVNVSAGQAVVGINPPMGGGTHENASQPHVPSRAHEQSPPMLGHKQAVPLPMPRAGSDRLARVPVPRCAERSTEGKSERRVAGRAGDERRDCRAARDGAAGA